MRIELPIPLTLGELRSLIGAAHASDERPVRFLCDDTRTLKAGDLFIALHGKENDGHSYIDAAISAGAMGVISEREVTDGITVGNTHSALLDLASYSLKKRPIPVVAITGSVGKTGAKDAVAAALSPKFNVHKTSENENNELGVSKTVLSCPKDSDLLVLELGTNHPGEIAPLSIATRPTLAIITAIGSAHIGAFGSKEAILREKASITAGMTTGGRLLLSANDPLLSGYRWNNTAYVGIEIPADFIARGIFSSRFGTSYTLCHGGTEHRVFLHGTGRPRIFSSLFALAAATHFGVPCAAAVGSLLHAIPAEGRGSIIEIDGLLLIDDAYNASPEAVLEALSLLGSVGMGRRRLAVLGDMLELGEAAEEMHLDIGRAAARNADSLFAFGSFAPAIADGAREGGMAKGNIYTFCDAEACGDALLPLLTDGDTVLIKASNALGADRIVARIRGRYRDN